MDYRFGVLAQLLVEIHRDPKAWGHRTHMADFFPSLERLRPDLPDDDALDRKLEALGRAFGPRPS